MSFKIINKKGLTLSQQKTYITLYEISLAFTEPANQPFIPKKQWVKRYNLSGKSLRALAKLGYVEFNSDFGVRLSVMAFSNVEDTNKTKRLQNIEAIEEYDEDAFIRKEVHKSIDAALEAGYIKVVSTNANGETEYSLTPEGERQFNQYAKGKIAQWN